MKKIDFAESGILVKNIIKDKLIQQHDFSLENGDIFIESAWRLKNGDIKVKGYQFAKEFSFEKTIMKVAMMPGEGIREL